MKILIGGLLPTQQRVIESACPAEVKLRFVTADKNPRSWALAGQHCDYCVLITGFVNHKHGERLKSTGCKVVYHTGGISKLKDLLQELIGRAP